MSPVQAGQRDPLGKVLKILRWLLDAPDEPYGVGEISHHVKMPPSTVHRLLKSLEAEGLVFGNASGHYRIGLELCRIGWQAQTRFPAHNIAMPVLRSMVEKTSETAFLALYDPQRMAVLIAAAIESPQPVRYAVPTNQWLDVHYAASGLAVMAFLPPTECQEIVKRTGRESVTSHPITAPSRFEAELERIRREGYACTVGQRVPGAVSIAVPVWSPQATILGSLNLTFPEFRIKPEEYGPLVTMVKDHGAELTSLVGGQTPTAAEIADLGSAHSKDRRGPAARERKGSS